MLKRRYTIELLISFLLITAEAYSYDFQSGSIYYNILNGSNVEVTSGDAKYEGDVVVPDKGTKSAYQSTACWNKFTNKVESFEDNTSTKRTIHVTTAGTLANLISESEKYTIEELILTGELNGTDFRLLRDMAGCNYLGKRTSGELAVLDLTNAKIVAGGEKYLDTNNISGNGIDYGGSFHYDISQNNVIPQAVFFGCYLRDIHVPNTVTSIKERAFGYCRDISSISLPNSVTSIGNYAFYYCSGLTSISIPNSVTSIGNYAFDGTAWYNNQSDGLVYAGKVAYMYKGTMSVNTSIVIDDGTLGIAVGVFKRCTSLISITIPNSVISIGDYAFSGCEGLTSITLPSSVTSIGDYVFSGCSGLSFIIVESGNKKYDSRNSCNAIIETSSNTLIAGCKNTTIPSSVTSIGDYAFGYCRDLTSITIPSSVTSIGNYAFYDCSGLTSITIPSSVTSIGDYAFDYCRGLTSVTIPNSVTSIGNYAFSYCSGLTSIKVESDNKKYDSRNSCNAIIETSSNTLIAGCMNTTIPSSVTSIGDYAFGYCRDLTSITIPSSVTSIGNYAFYDCSGLTSITIPSSVTSIGDYAFDYCRGLTSVTIPNSVTSIGNYAFSSCSGLTSITIPSSVTSIGDWAFAYCFGLFSVISEIQTPFEIARNVFSSETYTAASLNVPEGKRSAYQSTSCWNNFRIIKETSGSETKRDNLTWSSVSPAQGTLNELPQSINILYNEFVNVSKEKTYIYGDVKNFPDQVPFQPGAWDAAAMRFSSTEGAHFPTLPDDVYFNLKTLIFDVSDVSEDFDLKVMNGWWSNTYYDHLKWQSGLNELQITDVMAVECARGGGGHDLDLMLYSGSCTINFVYYEDKEEVTFYKNGVMQFKGQIDITEGNSKSVTLSYQHGVIADEGVWTIKVPEGFIYNRMMGNVDDERWNPAFTLTYIVQSTGEGNQERKRTIHVATAGTLSNYITESEKYTIEELTLTGELNGTDFRLLRDMAGKNYLGQNTSGRLKVLDLANAKIVVGGEKYLVTYNIEGNGISYHHNILQADIIPEYVFFGCHLKTIYIPSSVTSIGNGAFYDCSGLTSITIPNSVTSIGNGAFYDCRGLTSITIPSSVTSIGSQAFYYCSGLTSIKVESGNKKYDSRNSCNAIIETSSNTLIAGCMNTTIPSSVTSIGDYAFGYCRDLTSITIPSSVTSIGNYAFYDCSGLTSITIPSSVTSIGDYAFDYCRGLTSVTIPNSVTSIGNYAFSSCSGLTSIAIPNSVTSIGKSAFRGCSGLTSITIPSSVTSIGDDAFYNCSGLTSISIPNSVTSIGNYAFYRCSGLKDIISEIKTPFEINEKVFSVYSTATLTVPYGTKSAYQSTAGWNKFTNIVEKQVDNIIQGDANGDKEVNVSDIVEVINFIMDNPSAIFLKANADINGDGEVNVTDIVMMVNIIMSGQYSEARIKDGLVEDPTDGDCLTLIEGGEGILALNLENRGRYVASQFDLRLSNGQKLESITLNNERLIDHKIVYKQTGDNCYKVIVYSVSNKIFTGESGKLLNIDVAGSGEIRIGNILFVTKSCQEKHFGPLNSITTGIINAISAEREDIYGIDGRHLRKKTSSTNGMAKGVYIINGKKHIVR